FPYVGSVLLWHTPVVALGLWLGSRFDQLPDILRRGTRPAPLLTLCGAAVYFPPALEMLRGHNVNTFALPGGEWVHVTAAAFLLLALSARWGQGGGGARLLRLLGGWSLQIYLAHPFVLILLDRLPAFTHAFPWPARLLLNVLLALVVPLLFAILAKR